MNSRPHFGKVAVLMGGNSPERQISQLSGNSVLQALLGAGVDAHPFDPAEHSLTAVVTQQIERAFLVLHGPQGEDGTVQGALECLGIPYTGSGVIGSAIGMDKWRCKLIWQAVGLPTPEFVRLEPQMDVDAVIAQLNLPLIVKPAAQGSSLGVQKIETAAELKTAYQNAAEFGPCVLAERFIEGAEYNVPILREHVLPSVRIQPAVSFYDYAAKYLRTDTAYCCPSGLEQAVEESLKQLVKTAFSVIGGRGWGRVDLIIDESGRPYLLEVNTAPGMTPRSIFPKSAAAVGIDYTNLVLDILETSFSACGV